MPAKKIAVVIGSLRKDSINRKFAHELIALAPPSLEFEIVEIGELAMYNQDLEENGAVAPQAWTHFRQRIKEADGVLFFTPEYNRSVPGALKNAIDVGSRPYGSSAWSGKPAAIVSISPGATGAFGANHHLRQSMVFLDMPLLQQPEAYITPYEKGNQNQTTLWTECIAFYQELAQRFPQVLRFEQIGVSDGGIPVHAGVVSPDGVFDREQIKAKAVRSSSTTTASTRANRKAWTPAWRWCATSAIRPERLAGAGQHRVPVRPAVQRRRRLNRANTSRVNQDGPEQFGFRGNSRHLDLNRDFVKCDTLTAQTFNKLFTSWDPDVMVDTHTSNGADYQLHDDADPHPGGQAGLRNSAASCARPCCRTSTPRWTARLADLPLRQPGQGQPGRRHRRIPGSAALLDRLRGAAPHDRLHARDAHAQALQGPLRFDARAGRRDARLHRQPRRTNPVAARRAAKQGRTRREWPIHWAMDESNPSTFRFKGYAAKYKPACWATTSACPTTARSPWEKRHRLLQQLRADPHRARAERPTSCRKPGAKRSSACNGTA
jgi:chromate reductase